jgi:hypothetical protein
MLFDDDDDLAHLAAHLAPPSPNILTGQGYSDDEAKFMAECRRDMQVLQQQERSGAPTVAVQEEQKRRVFFGDAERQDTNNELDSSVPGDEAFYEMQRVIERMREQHPSPPASPGGSPGLGRSLTDIERRVWEEAEDSWAEFEQEFEYSQRQSQPGLHALGQFLDAESKPEDAKAQARESSRGNSHTGVTEQASSPAAEMKHFDSLPGSLPAGWVAVPSRSRQGAVVYLNRLTNQRYRRIPQWALVEIGEAGDEDAMFEAKFADGVRRERYSGANSSDSDSNGDGMGGLHDPDLLVAPDFADESGELSMDSPESKYGQGRRRDRRVRSSGKAEGKAEGKDGFEGEEEEGGRAEAKEEDKDDDEEEEQEERSEEDKEEGKN